MGGKTLSRLGNRVAEPLNQQIHIRLNEGRQQQHMVPTAAVTSALHRVTKEASTHSMFFDAGSDAAGRYK